MKKEFKINKNLNVNEIRNLHNKGYRLLCPVCSVELNVSFTLDEANKKGLIPGVYCPNDGSHFYLHLNLREARENFWDDFK